MKKTLSLLVAVGLGIAAMPLSASGYEMPLRVVVNGERIFFPDAQPFVDENDRAQVPIRFVSEALGADVLWDNDDKVATIELDEKKLVLTVGQTSYELNGATKSMDTSAQIQEERTFVPLRFVSEGLGAVVEWDAAIKTAYIDTSGASEPDHGSDNEIVEAEYYGFKVKHNTGSMLDIRKGPYDELGKVYSLLDLLINFTSVAAEGKYEAQFEEAEEILLQKIDEDTVASVMEYVRKKTQRSQMLEMKIFSDDTYEVFVISPGYGDTNITIFYK